MVFNKQEYTQDSAWARTEVAALLLLKIFK